MPKIKEVRERTGYSQAKIINFKLEKIWKK